MAFAPIPPPGSQALTFTIDECSFQLIWDQAFPKPIGTGFSFLRPDWVATAKHVVEVDGLPRRNLVIEFINGPSLAAHVYAWHPMLDIAILKVPQSSPCRTPLFPAYVRFTGQQGLVSVGYKPSLTRRDEDPYSLQANAVNRWELEQRSRKESEEEVIIFPAPDVERGHSGGPLLGQGGAVVGVVIEGFTRDDQPFARATSILSLLNGFEIRSDWRL